MADVKEINIQTGEIVERDFTPEEIEQNTLAKQQQDIVDADKQAYEDLKTSAKAKLIAGEPLTEEEASTIVL